MHVLVHVLVRAHLRYLRAPMRTPLAIGAALERARLPNHSQCQIKTSMRCQKVCNLSAPGWLQDGSRTSTFGASGQDSSRWHQMKGAASAGLHMSQCKLIQPQTAKMTQKHHPNKKNDHKSLKQNQLKMPKSEAKGAARVGARIHEPKLIQPRRPLPPK